VDLSRLLSAFVVLALLTSSCTLFSSDDNGATSDVVDVAPPPAAPTGLTALPGLVLHTNSESLGRIMDAPEGEGVVVMFVQPDGPSDGQDIERGDLLVEVDGERVTNHERAIAMLRSEPGQERRFKLTKVGGDSVDVTVEARDPQGVQVTDFYDRELQRNADDAVTRFLRGWATGPSFEQRLEDLDAAIAQIPDFVEAIILRAGLLWDRAAEDEVSDEEKADLRRRATADWEAALELDEGNPNALVSRSRALSQAGQAARAKADAEAAVSADATFPAAHYSLALAEYRLANYDAAARPARRAIDLNPFHFTYYELMGSIFVKLGQQECLETGDALEPLLGNAPEAKEQLEQVCEG